MSDFIELRHIAAILARRWWVIGLSIALCAVSANAISRSLPRTYEATTTLLVGQSIQAANLDSRDIQVGEHLAVTYAAIGRRQPVLEGVVETLGLDQSWQQLRRQVRIDPIAGTQLLEITVEAGSPAEARIIADEVARQMIILSPSDTQTEAEAESQLFLEERLESLRLRIENGQMRIEELEGAILDVRTATEMTAYQTEIDNLEQLITNWESNYAQLLTLVDSDSTVNNLTVMEAAESNPQPVRPRIMLNTMLGGILGALLALAGIVLREYMDDSLKTTDDLKHVLGLTSLGAVSEIRSEGYRGKLLSSLGPFSPTSEAFSVIRSNIRYAAASTAPGVILITSAKVGEGKSLTVANLGLAMARSGLKTVIVDADLRRPAQHVIFETANEKGVTERLRSSELAVDEYLSETGVASLKLMPSGERPPNPSELLGSEQMDLLLAGLIDSFEMVIIDGPPVLSGADAAVLSTRVDAVIMVVHSGRTRRNDARRAVSVLQQVGAHILGAVLNRAEPTAHDYHYMPSNAALDGQKTTPYFKRLRARNLQRVVAPTRIDVESNGRSDMDLVSDGDE